MLTFQTGHESKVKSSFFIGCHVFLLASYFWLSFTLQYQCWPPVAREMKEKVHTTPCPCVYPVQYWVSPKMTSLCLCVCVYVCVWLIFITNSAVSFSPSLSRYWCSVDFLCSIYFGSLSFVSTHPLWLFHCISICTMCIICFDFDFFPSLTSPSPLTHNWKWIQTNEQVHLKWNKWLDYTVIDENTLLKEWDWGWWKNEWGGSFRVCWQFNACLKQEWIG